MDLACTCPLRVASLIWQPRPGAWVLTVVCKATLVLVPGECVLSSAQAAPADEDRYVDHDRARSVRIPRDLVPVRPGVDVLLVGSAFAPDRKPVRSLVARLRVGDIDKSIEVVVDRGRRPDGTLREGPPFAQMPLVYERAAGGPGTRNPVGVRPDARDADGATRLPNLQRPGAPAEGAIEPVGFGPIAPTWPERRDRLVGPAAGWSFQDLAQRPLPEGMDLGFFNAAPRDQQLRALEDRQRITLENLHPEHATLVTSLPALGPRAVLEGRRAGPQPIVLRADALLVDTDRGLCTVTYRGMVPLEGAAESGRVVVSMDAELPAEGTPGAEAAAAFKKAPRNLAATADLPLAARKAATLPFSMTEPPKPPPQAFAQAPPAPPPPPQAFVQLMAAPAPPAPIASPWAAPGLASAAPPLPLAVPARAPSPGVSVLEASDAAAGALRVTPRADPAPPRAQPSPEPAPAPAARAEPGAAFELLWFDAESMRRIRKNAAWRPLLDALEDAPVDPDFDDPALAEDEAAIEDRREIFEILAHAEPSSADGLHDGFSRCFREDGRFVPTLALFAGELELPFDELAALRATLTTASPLAGQDDALKSALQAAKDFLATPGLMSAPAVAEGLTKRIEDAFAQGKRVVPAGYLEAQRERALLEQRQYQRRTVFGGKHLRGLLRGGGAEHGAAPAERGKPAPAGGASPVPAYLPERLAEELPMFPRFRARIVAEVRMAADRYEACPAALRVLALARVAAPPKG